ncbi:hypothetical protein ANN_06961 [Periplaneta americana]|uniref:Calponin-homology (CH) domain-containing protein n=1 Tax=Periplaneta americana TaxID=6978 RepID=A0ABQ8TH44_PERAM|nr:hypothetical protein ANN_06961 [Periplaneta americana]
MAHKHSGNFFEVKITPEPKRKPVIQDDKDNILVLAPFNSLPKIVFENVTVGTSKHQNIIVKNPQDSEVEVELDRLPPKERGLLFSDVDFTVEAHGQKLLQVTWSPPEAGSWRHMIKVKNSYCLKLDIAIACSSVDAQKGKKKNVKPLRAQNTSSSTVTVKKSGIKPFSYSKTNISMEARRKSNKLSSQIINTTSQSNQVKQKQRLPSSNEEFIAIKNNRLPPCTVPATPTRRKTYVIVNDANKENKESEQFPLATDSSPLSGLRRLEEKNKDLTKTKTYNSHPRREVCSTGGKKKFRRHDTNDRLPIESPNFTKEGRNDTSPLKGRNFNEILDALNFTPTSPTELDTETCQYSTVNSNISSVTDRRQTFEIPSLYLGYESRVQVGSSSRYEETRAVIDSRYENEETRAVIDSRYENETEIEVTEELVYTTRRVRQVQSFTQHCNPLENEKFDDSLEQDIFEGSFTESKDIKWNTCRERVHFKSEESEENEMENESVLERTSYNQYRTGITPKLDKLTLSAQNLSFSKIQSPVDFSFLPPTVNDRRCSTVMKTEERNANEPTSKEICKDLFSTDLDSIDASACQDMSCLSSETYVKSSSSFPDMNFHYSDISCQESSFELDSKDEGKPTIAGNNEENSAQSVIEAGLWLVPQNSEKHSVKLPVNTNIRTLDTITEESKCSESIVSNELYIEQKERLSQIPVKNAEKCESRGILLEISPPKGQLCGIDIPLDSHSKQKGSRIAGWSKTSVKSKIGTLRSTTKEDPLVLRTQQLFHTLLSSDCEIGVVWIPGHVGIRGNEAADAAAKDGATNGTLVIPPTSVQAQRPRKSEPYTKIPRKAIAKLTLSASKKPKEESVKLYSPDDILNKLANPGLFEASAAGEPFITSSVYYDEEWMVQQEREFVKWLNSLLTPPEELDSTTALPKVDVAELWIQSCRTQDIEPAPSRETVSSKYHTQHRLDALRKAAFSLFRSQDVAQILSRVVVHVDKKLIEIRNDRDLPRDFGLKCKVMELLLSYNPLWLRIGLETIYGQTIPLESNSDVRGLAKFIAMRLLSDPYIVQQNAHPTVCHLYLPGFEDAMKKFTLKKFLLLVYFLDKAKERKLISHDPCLFCKDSKLKDSRQILLAFSRDLLAGVGDITKHLKTLGYVVTQSQNYLEEFEYAVTCLGTDLRDGVRLTRVMEIILQNKSLSRELRVPAVSRLQKIHNVNVALLALQGAGYVLTGDITAKDICDGHREKTLSLLWQIIYKFQAPRFDSAATKIQKWWRHQSLKLEIYRRIQSRKIAHFHRAATKIQTYWRCYYARKMLKILKQQNALTMARRNEEWRCIKAATAIQNKLRATLLMRAERQKFLELKSTVIFIQRKFRAKLLMKNEMETYQQLKLTVCVIQNKFRATLLMKSERQEYLRMKFAAVVIQRRFRATLQMKKEMEAYQQLKAATYAIQEKFRATLLMRSERQKYLEMKFAAIAIQRKFRAFLLRKKQNEQQQLTAAAIAIQKKFRATCMMKLKRQKFLELKFAAIVIQRMFRATLQMKKERERYQQLRSATIFIQNKFRAKLLMRAQRQEYLEKKFAATAIQRRFRAFLLRKKENEQRKLLAAAVAFQKKFRAIRLMKLERQKYLELKFAAIVIQRKFRASLQMKKERKRYQQLRSATCLVQNSFRAKLLMRAERQKYVEMKCAAIVIQRKFRASLLMKKEMETYQQLKAATCVIQKKFRAILLMRSERQKYLKMKFAAIVIQKRFRAFLLRKKENEELEKLTAAAIAIQKKFRATQLMRLERQKYLELKFAAIIIQRTFRATLQMEKEKKRYWQLRSATCLVQNLFRAKLLMKAERQKYVEMKYAAIVIQRKFRASLLMKKEMETYQQLKAATCVIQKKFRATLLMRSERQKYLKMKFAAIVIQKRVRAFLLRKKENEELEKLTAAAIAIQKKFRATQLMRLERQKYLELKFAAITIQRTFRATLQMEKEKKRYQQLRSATCLVQNLFRAKLLMKAERQKYVEMKYAAIVIQRKFRASLLMKKEMETFQQLKAATCVIQKKFRATLLMRSEKQKYLKMKFAAVVIQRTFRATLQMKKERKRYQQLRSATCLVQNTFRAKLLMRAERQKYVEMKYAAIVIQRKFRASLLMKKEMKSYQQLKAAALFIQNKFRDKLLMKSERQVLIKQKCAAISIQRWYRYNMKRLKDKMFDRSQHLQKEELFRRQTSAAIKIQPNSRKLPPPKFAGQSLKQGSLHKVSVSDENFDETAFEWMEDEDSEIDSAGEQDFVLESDQQ